MLDTKITVELYWTKQTNTDIGEIYRQLSSINPSRHTKVEYQQPVALLTTLPQPVVYEPGALVFTVPAQPFVFGCWKGYWPLIRPRLIWLAERDLIAFYTHSDDPTVGHHISGDLIRDLDSNYID